MLGLKRRRKQQKDDIRIRKHSKEREEQDKTYYGTGMSYEEYEATKPPPNYGGHACTKCIWREERDPRPANDEYLLCRKGAPGQHGFPHATGECGEFEKGDAKFKGYSS